MQAPLNLQATRQEAAQITEFLHKTGGGSGETTKLSFEQTENLHALGYMNSNSDSSSDADDQNGPDPKQRIAVANVFYEALVDVANERYDESVPILEQVIKQEPNTPSAYLQLGRAYVLQGDTAKARAAYQDFLTLWKDGDADIPILREAKAEYARLQ